MNIIYSSLENNQWNNIYKQLQGLHIFMKIKKHMLMIACLLFSTQTMPNPFAAGLKSIIGKTDLLRTLIVAVYVKATGK